MAMNTAERSARAAKKRKDGDEEELRMWTKPATRTVLEELMEWHGITEQAEAMTRLIRHADIITPNLTEACLMAGQPYENADVDALLDALGGAQTSVLVTSAGDAVAGKDARTGRRFRVPFRRIPGEHWGTGDRFCALLLDALASGLPLEQAAKRASDGVYEALLNG